MASNFLDKAVKRTVLFSYGGKLVKAPFDILTMPSGNGSTDPPSTFISTTSAGGDLGQLYNADAVADEQLLGAGDFGFMDPTPMIIGAHEMGNWEEHPESWKGMQRLNLI